MEPDRTELCILGPVLVTRAGAQLPLSPAQRRLVAALLIDPSAPAPVDWLIWVMWGDRSPATARKQLQMHVSRLRKRVRAAGADQPPLVRTDTAGYSVDRRAADIDAVRFEDLTAEARATLATEPDLALASSDDALGLWRGRAFGEFAADEFAQAEHARLEELRLAASETRIDALLAVGDVDRAVADLQVLVDRHPLRERLVRQLMTALHLTGRSMEALRAFQSFRTELADGGLEPSRELRDLESRIVGQDPTLRAEHRPAKLVETGPHNLPISVSSFVGRHDETKELDQLLGEARLLNLVGPGGVGKTRLALEVANAHLAHYRDGTWLVDLSPVADGDALVHAVAQVLDVHQLPGCSMSESVVTALAGRECLLVLDTCEHVLDAAARLVDAIVHSCASVSVLTTSRAPLGIEGELVWTVDPLGVPASADVDPAALRGTASVDLFTQRAQAASRRFKLTDDNATAVAEICRRLDGLPLAIELAAGRTPSMEPTDMAGRLDDRLRLLTGRRRDVEERHQTLRATIDWSYRLLDDTVQCLFDRLSVFAGGFDLGAVEAVCAGGPIARADVADLLAQLVDRCMVTTERDPPRHRLLDTLRQYGADRLAGRHETDAVAGRHASYYSELVERAAEGTQGEDQPVWIATIEREFENIRAAHRWATAAPDFDVALGIPVALYEYAYYDGLRGEVYTWAAQALAAHGADGHPLYPEACATAATGAELTGHRHEAERLLDLAERSTSVRGLAPPYLVSHIRGTVAMREGRPDAIEIFEEAHRNAVALGDEVGAFRARGYIGWISLYRGDTEAAEEIFAASRRDYPQMYRSPGRRAWHHYSEAERAKQEDPEKAAEHLQQALDEARSVPSRLAEQVSLVTLGALLARHGDEHRALELLSEAITEWRRLGEWSRQWPAVRNVIELFDRLDRAWPAAVLYGATDLAGEDRRRSWGAEAERLAALATRLQDELGATEFQRATQRGAAMTADDVVAYALTEMEHTLDQLTPTQQRLGPPR